MRCRPSQLSTLLLAMYWFGPLTHAEGPEPHGVVAEDTYAFGSIRQGGQITHAFAIRNVGTAPLRITGATLSAGGMNLHVAQPEIPPQGQGTVTIDLATEHLAGAISAEAQVQWNDPKQPQAILKLEGYVTASIAIEPMPAIFLSAFAGQPAERTLTIRNNDTGPLAITRVEHSQHLIVTVTDVEPGRVLQLTARPAGDVGVGRYEELLTLVTNKSVGSRIDIPVHLWVKPDLYANPATVEFGDVRIADVTRNDLVAPLTQTLFLKHRSGAFEITSIRCDSAMVDVTRSPASASDSFQIDVRLRPKALRRGAINGEIRVITNDPTFPEIAIPLRGRLL